MSLRYGGPICNFRNIIFYEILLCVHDLGRSSSNPFLSFSMDMDPIHLDLRYESLDPDVDLDLQ